MWDSFVAALPTTIAQAAGAFLFMVSHEVLGRSRFKTWTGLASAIVWFILGTIGKVVLGIFKRGAITPPKNEGEKNGIDRKNEDGA